MRYSILFIIQILVTRLCHAQELILKDGIYFEKPIYRDTTNHKYSLDNTSYKVNSVYIFDYFLLSDDGNKKKFLYTKDESSKDNPLNLVAYDNKTEDIIDRIKIEVDDNMAFSRHDSNYTQTICSYMYLNRTGRRPDTLCDARKRKNKSALTCADEWTGIVDNAKNLWMHPPRLFTFKILQLNPFPLYYIDENIKTWTWKMKVGGFYLDPRWINQKELTTINFTYKRLPDESIETPMGKLKCKVTDGTGTTVLNSGEFKTKLKSFYYPNYGFVRLEYTNVNGTVLVMQLIAIK